MSVSDPIPIAVYILLSDHCTQNLSIRDTPWNRHCLPAQSTVLDSCPIKNEDLVEMWCFVVVLCGAALVLPIQGKPSLSYELHGAAWTHHPGLSFPPGSEVALLSPTPSAAQPSQRTFACASFSSESALLFLWELGHTPPKDEP